MTSLDIGNAWTKFLNREVDLRNRRDVLQTLADSKITFYFPLNVKSLEFYQLEITEILKVFQSI